MQGPPVGRRAGRRGRQLTRPVYPSDARFEMVSALLYHSPGAKPAATRRGWRRPACIGAGPCRPRPGIGVIFERVEFDPRHSRPG